MFHGRWTMRTMLWLSAWALSLSGDGTAHGRTQLAKDARASLPVVVSDTAAAPVRETAAVLAEYLGRMSGATFELQTGDGPTGIAVGLVHDFPSLGLGDEFDAEDAAGKEQYILRSHPGGMYVIGATSRAVEHAAWDLLYRLGHRQFFPGKAWEIVPKHGELSIDVDANEKPDYLSRNIWYGFGTWGYNDQPWADWRARNRAVSVFQLNSGHAYDTIVSQYQEEFDAHPEYFCRIEGKSTSKFCTSQQGLRDLVVRYALDHFERHPDTDTVSIDPSDGPGWSKDGPCVALGSPSDRAVTLANEIGKALDRMLPDKYVAMYAYGDHSPPPNIRVHPRVIISVATGFIRGGYSVDQLLERWAKQGVRQFGIREYYGVNQWDRDLPGLGKGSDLRYLARTIRHYHEAGVRFMSAESSDNWGPNGLGYYLATRILWDVDEAERIDELKTEFFETAFGPARKPIETFYELLDGSNQNLLSEDLVGRMYRLIDEASNLAEGDAAVKARLDDLTLYAHYVERYRAYSEASGPARQAAFERLIRHAYRMRRTMMVHAKALYRDLDTRDKQVSIPEGATWEVPEDRNPWKNSEPFTRSELDAFVVDGIANHKLLGFKPVAFSSELRPATPLKLRPAPPGTASWTGRGERSYFTWVEKAPAEICLTITGGLIAHYRDRGDVRILLYPAAEVEGRAVAEAAVPPDGQPHSIMLRTDHVGLHRIELSDGHDMTRIQWDPKHPMTFETTTTYSGMTGRHDFVFYVPRGTRIVGGFVSGPGGAMHDARDRKVYDFVAPGYFEVPVPRGQDGTVWSVRQANARVKLMTVPPYASHSAASLLLPAEVLAADAR